MEMWRVLEKEISRFLPLTFIEDEDFPFPV